MNDEVEELFIGHPENLTEGVRYVVTYTTKTGVVGCQFVGVFRQLMRVHGKLALGFTNQQGCKTFCEWQYITRVEVI